MGTTRLEQWEKQKAALEERIKMAKARDKSRERKADNRRKYLYGAMLTRWMEQDEAIKDAAAQRMESFLVRDSDRRAFGLAPLPQDALKDRSPTDGDTDEAEDTGVSAA